MMDSTRKTKNAVVWIISVLLLYAVWARSGIYPPFQPLMLSISAVLAMLPFCLLPEHFLIVRKALTRNPVFWAGVAFVLLLSIQWANTDYTLLHNASGEVWLNRQPSRWIPWSVSPDSGAQLLTWFVPSLILILAVRHLLEPDGVQQVLYIVVWNSALCAAVGIVQYLSGAERMLWVWEIPGGSFFATFGYVNHGAAYFYMNAAVATGLVHDGAVRSKPPVQLAVWTFCALINLAAAFLTLSRAGAVGGLIVLAAASVVLIFAGRNRFRSAVFLHGALVALLILLTGAVLFLRAGHGRLFAEFQKTVFDGPAAMDDLEGRMVQVPQAWEIFKEYPLFGSGGWGYRWLAKAHIPMAEWPAWRGAGRANVHCDPLQFLSEFGVFGMACFCAVLGTLISRAAFGGLRLPLFWWTAGALLLVFFHSLIDLPFRCPAVLFEWSFLLAALPFWCLSCSSETARKNTNIL